MSTNPNEVRSAISGVNKPEPFNKIKVPASASLGMQSGTKVPAPAPKLQVAQGKAQDKFLAVKTRPGRGRQPVYLKNGQLLADARVQVKAAIAEAKTAFRQVKIAVAASAHNVRLTNKSVTGVQKTLDGIIAKPLPMKAEQAALVASTKASLKGYQATAKEAAKVHASDNKELVKADVVITKALIAQIKVEESKLSKPTVS